MANRRFLYVAPVALASATALAALAGVTGCSGKAGTNDDANSGAAGTGTGGTGTGTNGDTGASSDGGTAGSSNGSGGAFGSGSGSSGATTTTVSGLTTAVFHDVPSVTFADVTTELGRIATYLAANSPGYTFLDTTAAFSFGATGNDGSSTLTSTFLGSDASGAAAADTQLIGNTIVDAKGYFVPASSGTYTFHIGAVDDGASVYIYGNGASGSGTLIVSNTYQSGTTADATASLTAGTPVPLEIFYGNGFGGASLAGITIKDATGASVTYQTTVTTSGTSTGAGADAGAGSGTGTAGGADGGQIATSCTNAPDPNKAPMTLDTSCFTSSFEDDFAAYDISSSTLDDGLHMNEKWFNGTDQCCMNPSNGWPGVMYPTPDQTSNKAVNPYSLLPGGGLQISLTEQDNEWFSGVMTSVDGNENGFSQMYGYFEMSTQLAPGTGVWPSFWMLSLPRSAPGGEIDIFEQLGCSPPLNPAVESIFHYTLHDWKGGTTPLAYTASNLPNLTTGYHRYGLLWNANYMALYFDGALITSSATPSVMVGIKYFLLADLGVGGGWDTTQTANPSNMLIKYIRAYTVPGF